jgi:hypothetical protein
VSRVRRYCSGEVSNPETRALLSVTLSEEMATCIDRPPSFFPRLEERKESGQSVNCGKRPGEQPIRAAIACEADRLISAPVGSPLTARKADSRARRGFRGDSASGKAYQPPIAPRRRFSTLRLEKAENFENDYDNDNDPDDVEDISVHGRGVAPRCRPRQEQSLHRAKARLGLRVEVVES